MNANGKSDLCRFVSGLLRRAVCESKPISCKQFGLFGCDGIRAGCRAGGDCATLCSLCNFSRGVSPRVRREASFSISRPASSFVCHVLIDAPPVLVVSQVWCVVDRFCETNPIRPRVCDVFEMSKNFCSPDMIHSSTRMGLMPGRGGTTHLPYIRRNLLSRVALFANDCGGGRFCSGRCVMRVAQKMSFSANWAERGPPIC